MGLGLLSYLVRILLLLAIGSGRIFHWQLWENSVSELAAVF